MIICSCKAINDAQLQQLQGVAGDRPIRLSDAVRQLGLGTGCGRCLRHAHSVLQAPQSGRASAAGAASLSSWAQAACESAARQGARLTGRLSPALQAQDGTASECAA